MSEDVSTKKKVPRDAAHLIQIQDQLKEVSDIIHEIRKEMADAGMNNVTLSTGTIFHWIGLAKVEAEKYRGAFKAQKAAHESRARVIAKKAAK